MGDPGVGPLGRTGRMERVVTDESRGTGTLLGRGEAGHPAAVRVAADGDVRAGRRITRWKAGTTSSAWRLGGRSRPLPRRALADRPLNGAVEAALPVRAWQVRARRDAILLECSSAPAHPTMGRSAVGAMTTLGDGRRGRRSCAVVLAQPNEGPCSVTLPQRSFRRPGRRDARLRDSSPTIASCSPSPAPPDRPVAVAAEAQVGASISADPSATRPGAGRDPSLPRPDALGRPGHRRSTAAATVGHGVGPVAVRRSRSALRPGRLPPDPRLTTTPARSSDRSIPRPDPRPGPLEMGGYGDAPAGDLRTVKAWSIDGLPGRSRRMRARA